MYYIKIFDGERNLIYQNTEIETLAEGVEILEEVFEDVPNSDNYIVKFNVMEE